MTAMKSVRINGTGGCFKKYMKKFLFLVLILVSCSKIRVPFLWPVPGNLANNPPDGPRLFRMGWVDGCDTGLSAYVSEFYTTTSISRFRKDFKLSEKEADYEIGWQIGFVYCLRAAERHDGFTKDKYSGI